MSKAKTPDAIKTTTVVLCKLAIDGHVTLCTNS